MSETVKRYAVIGFGHKQLVEHEDGRYVLASDYANLEQECERLRGLLMEAKAALDPFDDKLLEARIDAALSAKPCSR